ncbi:MAG TPA: methyltransferase domain-containing protein [Blastocatellia bacterium]|nr:methyltransferase domain-containing protein [Blastocatellia bacterium]
MSEIAYHLRELEIARTVDDARRILPELPEAFESILDLGCGIGQTLIACDLPPNAFACGVDVDEEALAYGRKMVDRISFVRASGEHLPFADGSFDVVISRVTLPNMHVPKALREISRALKPGGRVWFTLYPVTWILRRAGSSLKAGNLKNFAYQFYVMTNGVLFHLTGRQFRFPFNRRYESFQTVRSVTRAMKAVGFENVRAEQRGFFIVTASKANDLTEVRQW